MQFKKNLNAFIKLMKCITYESKENGILIALSMTNNTKLYVLLLAKNEQMSYSAEIQFQTKKQISNIFNCSQPNKC